MFSASRNRRIFFALALSLLLVPALAGVGLAAEGSSAGAGADDGSVFCDPATLPEGEVCSLTPDKQPTEAEAPAQAPAGEAGAERPSVSAAEPGEGETGGDETADASATRTGDLGSVPLARTGLRVWLPAVLGACVLLGGLGLLAASRRVRLDR
ncbi:MAG: hypothetical protein H0U12_11770 [Thermoleophilaceae bacterium]|nr:hypothetical protein [Thermoleophilaceae bacterium]